MRPSQPLASLEASPSPVLLVDAERGVIVEVNPAAAAFYGHGREALRGRPLAEIAPDDAARLLAIEGLGPVPARFVSRHRVACGDLRTVNVSTAPLTVDGRRRVFCVVQPELEPAAGAAARSQEVALDGSTRRSGEPPVQVAPAAPAPVGLASVAPVGPVAVASGSPAARLPVDSPESADGRKVVLVVDDEQLLRLIAERVLGMAGYRVLLAACGEEALALATDPAVRIDLLFTDIVMPGIHGPALATALREFRPGLRVLVASGFAPDESDREGLGLGDLPFLPKPYTPAELTATVGRILASVPS